MGETSGGMSVLAQFAGAILVGLNRIVVGPQLETVGVVMQFRLEDGSERDLTFYTASRTDALRCDIDGVLQSPETL